MSKKISEKKVKKEKKINSIEQLSDSMFVKLDGIFKKSDEIDKDNDFILFQIFWKTITEARWRKMCIHHIKDMFNDSLVHALEFEKDMLDEDIKKLKEGGIDD